MTYPNRLRLIWILALLVAVTFPFFITMHWWYLPAVVVIYLIFKGVGAEVGSHRYWTHRSFQTNKFWEKVMSILHLFNGDGTMIVFVGIHRLHHQYSDKEGDPHSPHLDLWGTIFYRHDTSKWSKRIVIDVIRDPWLQHLHKYYFHYHLLIAVTFAMISPVLLWFHAVNILCSWAINNLINVCCHLYGTRTYDTQDQSKNNWWSELILLGVGTHNNHHNDPSQISTAEKFGQYDLWGWIIKRIQTDGRKK